MALIMVAREMLRIKIETRTKAVQTEPDLCMEVGKMVLNQDFKTVRAYMERSSNFPLYHDTLLPLTLHTLHA